MTENAKQLCQAHLINILKKTKQHHPNFLLLLGAGASSTSKIRCAREMIYEWREEYFKQFAGPGDDKEKFFRDIYWHKTPEEYAHLFEALYDQPSQRREYIESCLEDASPSWGYIYLVNLIYKRVFNTVFTTNFDDLLDEACCTYSNNVRPLVCAHDSSIKSVRITSRRPKIIKLHGDFLFDNIKNTISELESLEDNMRDKFKQYAAEFGLIVVGYAGNDRTIMDILSSLLRNDLFFPHGVYWCIRRGSKPSDRVGHLRRYPKFKLVEIDGFDEFFAEIHKALGFTLQPELSDPYGELARRLNRLTTTAGIHTGGPHPIIDTDIKHIGDQIKMVTDALNKLRGASEINVEKQEDIVLALGNGKKLSLPIPFGLLAEISEDAQAAINYSLRQLQSKPELSDFIQAFRIMCRHKAFAKVNELMKLFKASQSLLIKRPVAAFDPVLRLIKAQEYRTAEEVLHLGYEAFVKSSESSDIFLPYYHLNRLQIKAYEKVPFSSEENQILLDLTKNSRKEVILGARILLSDFEGAEKLLLEIIKSKTFSINELREWPIIQLLMPNLKNKALFSDSIMQ